MLFIFYHLAIFSLLVPSRFYHFCHFFRLGTVWIPLIRLTEVLRFCKSPNMHYLQHTKIIAEIEEIEFA